MTSLPNLAQSFEYESPVEFVLVATVGRERAVIAKSKGAGIDLSSYSQKFKNFNDYRRSPLVKLLYPTIDDLRPLAVNSIPVKNALSNNLDKRDSEFTFVWRGIVIPGLEEKLHNILSEISPSLTDAFDRVSETQVEWLLSPLLAECSEAVNKLRNQRLAKSSRIKFIFITTFLYTVFVVATGLYYYFFKNKNF